MKSQLLRCIVIAVAVWQVEMAVKAGIEASRRPPQKPAAQPAAAQPSVAKPSQAPVCTGPSCPQPQPMPSRVIVSPR